MAEGVHVVIEDGVGVPVFLKDLLSVRNAKVFEME